ncbi:uncharacterized protein LOC129231677 [Uloborus diversus]|uniref:uncharacterized protein LOC129231677 n=1 Tax=Uloborus diversus TaxID=327109 RepID=UPI0024096098|nr:uncharacterized protein LOC129231677 [Uloborus diversus]
MNLSDVALDVNISGSVILAMMPTIPIPMEGEAAANLSHATAFLNALASFNESIMKLDDIEFDVDLDGLDVDFSGLNVSGISTTFLEDVVRKNYKSMLISQKAQFIDMASNYVKELVNEQEDDKIFKIIAELIKLIYDAVFN